MDLGMKLAYRKRIISYLLFLLICAASFWAHYPIGVFESASSWDKGHKAGMIYASIDPEAFKNDPFLSNMRTERQFTEFYFHKFFLIFFSSFESYFSFLNVFLLFSSLILSYELFLHLTHNNSFSILLATLFSFSTIWFSTGDIFAFVTTIGTCGKTMAFDAYLLCLILLFKLKDRWWGLYLSAFLISLMVWIHPITFLGVGLTTIFVAFILFAWENKLINNFRKGALVLIIVAIVSIGYIQRFVETVGTQKEKLPDQIETVYQQKHFAEYRYTYSPLSVLNYTIQEDFSYIKNYKILFFAALLCLLLWPKLNRHTKFFLLCEGVLVLSTFLIRILDYWMFSDKMLKFVALNRNLKWVYFYSFLALLSTYPFVSNIALGKKIPYSNGIVFCIFTITSIFFLHGPIKTTYLDSYAKYKMMEKIQTVAQRFKIDLPVKVRSYSINQVNADIEQLVDYILQNTDGLATFVGPAWLRYKTFRPVLYAEDDRVHYIISKDPRFLEWDKQEQIINSLNINDKTQYLSSLKKMGMNFFVLEKFKVNRDRSFESKSFDLEGLPVVFENRSFALIEVIPGKLSQPTSRYAEKNFLHRNINKANLLKIDFNSSYHEFAVRFFYT